MLFSFADAAIYLQEQYINSRFATAEDDWPPYQPKHYTTLALIHHEEDTNVEVISVTQELATKGDISQLSSVNYNYPETRKRATKSISDIFKFITVPASNAKMLLIEGAPGIGKTVLSKEVAYQWATGKLLNSVKFLLLVFLRTLSGNMKSVTHLMRHVFKIDKVADDVEGYLFKSKGKDLAIVFDGYDEMSEKDRNKSFVADIIKRAVFPQCLLVITSRPTASSHLHNIVNCRVEIIGFTEEDRLEYIKAAVPNSPEKVEALQLYLQSNPTINALCYIPLNMTILLCLTITGVKNLPKTQTELHKRFIEMTVVRFLKKQDDDCIVVTLNLCELPHPHDKVFKELSYFAFKALRNGKLVFSLAELKKSCPNLTETSNSWNGLGLLKSVKYFDFNKSKEDLSFHFLHFSLQEYMAAYYISKLSGSEQIRLLHDTFWKIQYYNTWIMYVGITGGESFALKHFLSGNWFQFFTRLIKSPSVSKSFIRDKIKCLHIFQCLAETKNHDLISFVGQCFRNQEIDLSNQTLLPNHLDTLGFFLIRSLCKQWKKLNLSKCSIGNIGCNTLSQIFLGRSSSHVNIEQVDFSYNHFSFLSLSKLFAVFKSWCTSEIIISCNTMSDCTSNQELYAVLENTFVQSNSSINKTGNLKLALIGSFLFACKLNQKYLLNVLVANAPKIASVYLLNINWDSNITEMQHLRDTFRESKLNSIHILDSSTNVAFVKAMCNTAMNIENNPCLFIHDSTLPDQDTIEIGCNLQNFDSFDNGIFLVIGKNKIQGMIKVQSLSNCSELSNLEILNLVFKVRSLGSNSSPVILWREDLQFHGSKSETIIHSFLEFLLKNTVSCDLIFTLHEGNTIIANHVSYEDISNISPSVTNIYLSYCCLNNDEYEELITRFKGIVQLYIVNSHLKFEALCTALSHNCYDLQELYLHGVYNISVDNVIILLSNHWNMSLVLVTQDTIITRNPTTKQLISAFYLEPSISTWKLLYCQLDFDVFCQIIAILTTFSRRWNEIQVYGCDIGSTEFEILYKNLAKKDSVSEINKLDVSLTKMTLSNVPLLVNIIFRWNIQELIINRSDCLVHDYLIEKLTQRFLMKNCQSKSTLSVEYTNRKAIYFYRADCKELMNTIDSCVTDVFLMNCQFSILENQLVILKSTLTNVSQMLFFNSSLSEITLLTMFELFMYCKIQISIFDDTEIYGDEIIDHYGVKQLHHKMAQVNFLVSSKNFVYGCNVTKHQLGLFFKLSIKQCFDGNVAAIIKQQGMFFFHNGHLIAAYFIVKPNATSILQIITLLNDVSTLKAFGINSCTISKEDAHKLKEIIIYNGGLLRLCLNICCTTVEPFRIILKALSYVSTVCVTYKSMLGIKCYRGVQFAITQMGVNKIQLQIAGTIKINHKSNTQIISKVKCCGNDINTEAAVDLVSVYFNPELVQKWCDPSIARNLLSISTLTTLCISQNIVTKEIADNITNCIFCNKKLQEVYIGGNKFHAGTFVTIAKAIKRISKLTALNVSCDNIAQEMTHDVAIVLSNSTKLELCIGTSDLHIAEVIKDINPLSTLTSIDITGGNLNGEAADVIADILYDNTELRKVAFSRCNLQESSTIKIAKVLMNISTLILLNIRYNEITEKAADYISSVLSGNVKLQEVDLSNNNFKAKAVIKVIRTLTAFSALTSLNFSNNNLNGEAADCVAEILSNSNKLQRVDLNRCNLQTADTIKIANALKSVSSTLSVLNIAHNKITEKAAADIATLLTCTTKLQELYIAGNNFQTFGVVKIANALLNITTLAVLDIGCNNISDNAADSIAIVLSHNINLQKLCVNGNNLQATFINKAVKALVSRTGLTALNFSHSEINEEATNQLAVLLSHNSNHLKQLCLDNCNLQTAGATIIAKVLKHASKLAILKIAANRICIKAADYIADVLSNKTELQVLCLNGNDLQTLGIKKIGRSLVSVSTLTILNISDNNISEEAADDISAALFHNVRLRELHIQKNNLKAVGAIKIARALRNISTLAVLNISDNNITEEAADDISAALFHNVRLQELHIQKNNLKAVGAIKIARALRNISTLAVLNISDNNITEEAADDLANALSCSTRLEEFHMEGNNLQTVGTIKIATALKKMSLILNLSHSKEAPNERVYTVLCNAELQRIEINGNNLEEICAITVVRALKNTTTLTVFNFSHNRITNETADDIAVVMSHNTKLYKVNLSETNLQTSGTIKIAKALRSVTSLTELNISYNNITEGAADNIATVVGQSTELQVLNLNGNHFNAIGCTKIAKALLMNASKLTELCISSNNITSVGAQDVGTALSDQFNLQILDVSANNLKESGGMIIARSLANVTTLTKLYIGKNEITDTAADDIAAVLSNNDNLQVLCLSGNDFNTDGILKIFKCSQNLSSLTELYVNCNHLTAEAADTLKSVISQNSKLQVFNISRNNFCAPGIIKIAKALQSSISTLSILCISYNNVTMEAADDIAAVVLQNTKLQVLDLGGNPLQTEGIIIIAKALQNISTLLELYINYNQISKRAADHIAYILTSNNNLEIFNVSENNLQEGIISVAEALIHIATLKDVNLAYNGMTEELPARIMKKILSKENIKGSWNLW